MGAVLRVLQPPPGTPPAELLALEESLLLSLNENPPAAEAQPFLFFFDTPAPAVVLGTGQKYQEVVNRAACERDGVPILRRPSGGGCVFHAPGVLWFSLSVPFTWLPSGAAGGIRATFADVLQPICNALQTHWQVPASLRGICDIAVETAPSSSQSAPAGDHTFRKLAGSAQCRKQRAVLVHGTLLHSADLSAMAPYLPIPEKQPEYRAGRAHHDFLTTLAPYTAATPAALRQAITDAWLTMLAPQAAALTGGDLSLQDRPLSAEERAAIDTLAGEKYRNLEWTFRL